MLTTPYPYQIEGAELIDEKFDGRALLADSMGVGKSLTALLWAERNPYARPIVVVCPASLKFNWRNEISIHTGWNCFICESNTPLKASRDNLSTMPGLVIINYDILGPWLKFLQALKPKLIILDECDATQSTTTQRTKNVR